MYISIYLHFILHIIALFYKILYNEINNNRKSKLIIIIVTEYMDIDSFIFERRLVKLNHTVKWLYEVMKNKISVPYDILNGKNKRGIYGLFVISKSNSDEVCAYVGKATNFYSRLFKGSKAHLVRLKNNKLHNSTIDEAMQSEEKRIEIRVLEEVTFQYENYNKDMQYLASRECYYIDKYQKLNQCLEQRPDGSNLYENVWNKEKKELTMLLK